MLEALRTRWKQLVIVPVAALALGSAGGVALNRYLVHADGADCCAPGMPCCHPGAPCCARHHVRVALR